MKRTSKATALPAGILISISLQSLNFGIDLRDGSFDKRERGACCIQRALCFDLKLAQSRDREIPLRQRAIVITIALQRESALIAD